MTIIAYSFLLAGVTVHWLFAHGKLIPLPWTVAYSRAFRRHVTLLNMFSFIQGGNDSACGYFEYQPCKLLPWQFGKWSVQYSAVRTCIDAGCTA